MSIVSYNQFDKITTLIKEKGVDYVLENLDQVRTSELNESELSNDDLVEIVKDLNEGLLDGIKGIFNKIRNMFGKKSKDIDMLIGDTSSLDKEGKFKTGKISGEFAKMEADFIEKDSKLLDKFYNTKDEKIRAQLRNEQKALDTAYEAKKNMLESKIKNLIGKDEKLGIYASSKKAEIDYAIAQMKYDKISDIADKSEEAEKVRVEAEKNLEVAKAKKVEGKKKIEKLVSTKDNKTSK